MGKTKIDVIVDAGKATPAPPLAPAIAPLGVNVGQVVAKINEATKEFMGVKVPVKVIVDTDTKKFEVEVGSPSVSSLIKKEANIEKGAGKRKEAVAGNITMEQVIKITKMKKKNMYVNSDAVAVRQVIGTCASVGVTVDGNDPKDAAKLIKDDFVLK